MKYKLIHEDCEEIAGYLARVDVPMDTGPADFRWSDGTQPEYKTHPGVKLICEHCKKGINPNNITLRRAS